MSSYLLECCVDSAESALLAEKGGADRFEAFVPILIIGGTTPTLALYQGDPQAAAYGSMRWLRPLFLAISLFPGRIPDNPGGVKQFRQQVRVSVVIGCLTPEGRLDKEAKETADGSGGGYVVTASPRF